MKRFRPHPQRFGAPMAVSVKILTILASTLLAAVGFIPLLTGKTTPTLALLLGPGICGILLLVMPWFAVRGFEVDHRELRIQRPLRQTRLSLKGLVSAQADPRAMKGSIRLLGNGGFYAFTGFFRNRKLGKYRAFITDPARCVVLKYSDRTVVVSPEDPKGFVRALGFDPEAAEERS